MDNCPMNINVPLTDKQVEYFCRQGCSVDCKKLLDIYIERVRKREGKTNK